MFGVAFLDFLALQRKGSSAPIAYLKPNTSGKIRGASEDSTRTVVDVGNIFLFCLRGVVLFVLGWLGGRPRPPVDHGYSCLGMRKASVSCLVLA